MRRPLTPLFGAVGCLLLLIGPSDPVSAQSLAMAPQVGGVWVAPDNSPSNTSGTQNVASNAAGTTDKTLVLTPTGSDKTFAVEVYNAESGDVLDTVEYTPGNTPPVTVPPGAKARVRDDGDSDSSKPKGTSTFG